MKLREYPCKERPEEAAKEARSKRREYRQLILIDFLCGTLGAFLSFSLHRFLF